jgi:hypothetical protein
MFANAGVSVGMVKIKVETMIDYNEADELEQNLGGFGGFFNLGMRWHDYIDRLNESEKLYAEAFREYVVANQLKQGGDWHQNSDQGAPLFSDNTSATFSYRAWGDIMAAIWAEEEQRDYHYMDFYMNSTMKSQEEIDKRNKKVTL